MTVYEIPTGPSQRTMTVALGAATYDLRLFYADAPDGGWAMDLSDAAGDPLVCGVPLVTGIDLLGQYPDLGVGGALFLLSDGADPQAVPGYADLGVTSHLLWKPNA